MALPSNQYIPLQGLQTYFVDKDTGEPLSAGYIEFYSDVARSTPKDVFVQSQLPNDDYEFINVGSVITLSSVGTTQNPNDGTDSQIYLFPYDSDGNIELYFLKVYSSGAELQITREAQPPNVASASNIETFEGSDNLISNPQFVETILPNTLTIVYNVTGTNTETPIAPDWSLITSGSGAVTVTQTPLIDLSMPTGAPFAIRISSSGITALTLRQTINESPRLFSNGSLQAFLMGSLVAKSFGASSVPLIMRYVASNAYTIDLVTQSTSADGNFNTLMDSPPSKEINTSNSNSPLTPGYVNIDIVIPASTDVGITSVQVVSTESANSSVPFIQISVARQIDHLFHDYKEPLEFKPIPSLLTGWDFPINPGQFGSTGTITTTPAYALDQTIGTCSGAISVPWARNAITNGISFSPTGNNAAFYVMQYLEGSQARKILGTPLSVNVNAYTSVVASGTTVRVYLLRGSSIATIPLLPTVLGTIAGSGVFTLTPANNWSEIPRNAQGTPTGLLNQISVNTDLNDEENDVGFSGWELTSASEIGDTDKFAIIATFGFVTAGTVVTVNSISLVPGDIPTRPAPQAINEVLRECQYYYEKSYSVGVAPGTATYTNSLTAPLPIYPPAGDTSNVTHDVFTQPFGYKFNAVKRNTSGIVTYYSPQTLNASGQVHVTAYNNGAAVTGGDVAATSWTSTREGDMSTQMIPNSGASLLTTGMFNGIGQSASVEFHYTIDDRLGIV